MQRLPTVMVMLLVAIAGCVDAGDSAPTSAPVPSTPPSSAASAPTTPEPVEERCIDETVDQPPEEAVGGADLAAWRIEDQLPPPLRTAGLQSRSTTILLDGEPVGEVSTEKVGDGIVATGYSFCVPADLELASIDVAGTLGGDWRLIDSTPELGLSADAEVRLTITRDWAGGRAVCNEYGGIVAAGPEGAWRISELWSTEIACAEAESDYFDRIGATTSWSLAGSELVLEGPKGALRYAPG